MAVLRRDRPRLVAMGVPTLIHTQDADFTLLNCDVLEGLKSLADGSVHCCVTSPPYWGLRDYGAVGQLGLEATPEEYVAGMVAVFREVKRVLRCDGTLFLNIGDSYASSAISMQSVWGDDSGARPREGDVREVLPPNGAAAMERGQSRPRAGESASLASSEQGASERTDHPAQTRNASADHRDARGEVPMLRRDGTSLPDDRSRSERRGERSEATTPSGLQEDSGRGLPERSLSNPLLELQLGEGDARSLPSFGSLKPKDLVGIPWMLAFALRADGWYLRADIIWSKPNPMPESVTDRPTKAHEYVFLLTKSPRYFFDQEAVRERYADGPGLNGGAYSPSGQSPHSNARGPDGRRATRVVGADGSIQHRDGERWPNGGRNIRSVWPIATQPYPEAHFATYPEELVRRCILAGTSERGCCPECGKPWERETETSYDAQGRKTNGPRSIEQRHETAGFGQRLVKSTETLGWLPRCACLLTGDDEANLDPVPCVVLDPFLGSGTTAYVARQHGRHSIGIELNESYCQLAARRMQQQSLFAQEATT